MGLVSWCVMVGCGTKMKEMKTSAVQGVQSDLAFFFHDGGTTLLVGLPLQLPSRAMPWGSMGAVMFYDE